MEYTPRDEDDFVRHLDYAHVNPVKYGCVERASTWSFSSVHRMVRIGLCPATWAGDAAERQNRLGER